MINDAEYDLWLADSSRDKNRVVLFEIEYSNSNLFAGHGRSNERATLNPVLSMTVEVYTNDTFQVLFGLPFESSGYGYGAWIYGQQRLTSDDGSFDVFQGADGIETQVAVTSILGDQYSIPFIATFTPNGTRQTIQGSVGNWENIGGGEGIRGTGVLNLATSDYQSEQGIIYDSFVTSEIEIEQSLDDFSSVGDFRAVNGAREIDNFSWRDPLWRGHRARVLHGDDEWDRSRFRSIASTLVEDVQVVQELEFQFDLMDGGRQFRRNTEIAEDTYRDSIAGMLSFVAREAGLPEFNYVNIPQDRLGWDCVIDIAPNDIVEDVIRKIVRSINGYIRINQVGGVDVFMPTDEPIHTITNDDVAENGMSMIDSTRSVANIEIRHGSERNRRSSFSRGIVRTGLLNETVVIETVLEDLLQVGELFESYLEFYRQPRSVWEAQVTSISNVMQVGDRVRVDHDHLKKDGIIKRIVRRPLSGFSFLDIQA